VSKCYSCVTREDVMRQTVTEAMLYTHSFMCVYRTGVVARSHMRKRL